MPGTIAARATTLVFSDPNTSGIVAKPLTDEQLKLLFDELMKAAESLPDLSDEPPL